MKSTAAKRPTAKTAVAKKKPGKKAPFKLSPLEKVIEAVLADRNFAKLLRKDREAALRKKRLHLTVKERARLEKWAAMTLRKRGGGKVAFTPWPPAWPGDVLIHDEQFSSRG